MNWFLDVLKNRYAQFGGRAGRAEYWLFWLFCFIIFVVLSIIGSVFRGSTILLIVFFIVSLAFVVPSIAVAVRRFHDQDKSGWFVLISLIPFVGGIILLVFMAMPSTEGSNRFGPPAPTSPDA
ncbi:MAG: DUF805 domain-containing protein [Burkholderiales bacterium]|jgi:uncharacterized membrane protein YhaH (DUF805 family)|nr:DUF805 domain-containing protein [Burkholderiales bacterium]